MLARISAVILLFLLLSFRFSSAQLVESYAGSQRAGTDILWFKYFQKEKEGNTPFLFFSRYRASADYHNNTSFGSTQAISYNFKNGVGIVSALSFINSGFKTKLGLQYIKLKSDFIFFGWVVIDLASRPGIDLFSLMRYQPKLNEQWKLMVQLELIPSWNTNTEIWSLTERLRIGPKMEKFSFGYMLDLGQVGNTDFISTHNTGGFIRYEF